jgi:voltage-gated potassium channel Kch
LVILAFILFNVGFWQHYHTWSEVLYAAISMLVNNELIKPDEMRYRNDWILSGQFLRYIVFYGVLLRLAYLAFGESSRRMSIRYFYHRHVIVCSLNEQGQAFISNLRQGCSNTKVIALIPEADMEQMHWCQQQGVTLLHGDARFASDLQTAGIRNADILLACSQSADTNLNIAYTVQQTLAGQYRRDPLKLYIALSDNLLSHGLGNENYQHFLQPCTQFNPYLYNVETLVARQYFNQHPPYNRADLHGQKQVHLVFAGFSPLVETMICQYARISPYKDFAPPIFTLLGPDAGQYQAELLARYPALGADRVGAEQVITSLRAIPCHHNFMLGDAELEAVAIPAPVTAVLFCATEEDFNFSRGMLLHQQTLLFNRWRAPFFLYINQNAGMQALLDSAVSKYPARQLTAFGMAQQVFNLDTLAEVERNAEFLHEYYRKPYSDGRDPATLEDRFKTWNALPETYRSANRRAGDHIAVKLASIGCYVTPGKPLILDDNITLTKPPEHEKLLSRLEHRSWRYERLLAGWRYGKPRNDTRRIHNSIQLWDDLPTAEKHKDVQQLESVRKALKEHAHGAPTTVYQEIMVGLIGHNPSPYTQVAKLL